MEYGKKSHFLTSFGCEIPIIPAELTFLDVFTRIVIVIFILYVLFRSHIYKIMNNSVSGTINYIDIKEVRSDILEIMIFIYIIDFFNKQSEKLRDYIEKSKNKNKRKKKHLFK